jgi:hypothetical protein
MSVSFQFAIIATRNPAMMVAKVCTFNARLSPTSLFTFTASTDSLAPIDPLHAKRKEH